MARASSAPKSRKRVLAEPSSYTSTSIHRTEYGSAFAQCERCWKNVDVALISMHNCSFDAKIRVNLEAQVVETQTEAEKKPTEKKKSTSDEPKSKRLRKTKSSSTSNKRKRPPTSFFIFMNDFRKTFRDENPNCKVKNVAKRGGEKWKSLNDEEKKVYVDEAAELKAEYNKSLENDEEDEDEQKQSDDIHNAEEEVENKDAEVKEEEEEILDDY